MEPTTEPDASRTATGVAAPRATGCDERAPVLASCLGVLVYLADGAPWRSFIDEDTLRPRLYDLALRLRHRAARALHHGPARRSARA